MGGDFQRQRTSPLLNEEGEQTTGNRGSFQGEASRVLEPAPSSSRE